MFVKLYAIAFPVFIAFDMLWIGLVAMNFYQKQIGFLMKSNISWLAAIAFYLIFIAGLVLFVIMPAVEKGSWVRALFFGAFFGFVAYATYDLTNLATLKNWPIAVTIADILWGMILSGSVSVLTYFIASKFFLIK